MPRGLVIVRNPDHLEGELTHVLNAVMIRYKLHRLAMSFAFTRFKPGGRSGSSQYVLLASAQPDLLAFARALDPTGLSRGRLTAIDMKHFEALSDAEEKHCPVFVKLCTVRL